MKRRWPLGLLLLCWLLILLVPPLRRMFWIQARGGSTVHQGLAYGPAMGRDYISMTNAPESNADDYRARAVKLDGAFYLPGQKPSFTSYDSLIARFPKVPLLLVRRLNQTMLLMHSDRLAGALDPAYTPPAVAQERSAQPPNFTKADIETALGLARRGQRMEPDNAFFDWAEFYFLMSAWRDGEAWPVLARASHKPRFDPHDSEWLQAQLHVAALRSGHLPTPEETVMVQAGSVSIGSHSKMRQMGRIVAWQAIKAERAGDAAKVLAIRGDYGRLLYHAARGANEATDMMTYTALAHLALSTDKTDERKRRAAASKIAASDPRRMEKLYRLRARDFSSYAAAHGGVDLAREIRALNAEAGLRQDVWMRAFQSGNYYVGLPARDMARAVALWWGAVLVLMLVPLFLLWWLALGALLRWASVPQVEIEQRAGMRVAAISFGVPLFCWTLALLLGPSSDALYIGRTPMQISFIASLVQRWPEAIKYLYSVLLASGLVAPGLVATYISLRARPVRTDRLKLRDRLRAVRLSTLLYNGALAILIGGAAILWLYRLNRDGSFFYWPPALPAPGFAFSPLLPLGAFWAGIALLWLRPLLSDTGNKPHAAYRLCLLHQSLGALTVVASVSYLMLLVVSLPIRARLDRQTEQLVQRGEVAQMLANSAR